MLELNSWFFVLAANFLVLIYILNIILFKPLLKTFMEREEAISGSIEKARDMELKREESIESLRKELSRASGEAKEKIETFKAEGMASQKAALEKARAEAGKIIEDARAKLREEAARARAELRENVERFSEEIVNKLVGV
jgi:F-type H+-transporting ATPase subunit b